MGRLVQITHQSSLKIRKPRYCAVLPRLPAIFGECSGTDSKTRFPLVAPVREIRGQKSGCLPELFGFRSSAARVLGGISGTIAGL